MLYQIIHINGLRRKIAAKGRTVLSRQSAWSSSGLGGHTLLSQHQRSIYASMKGKCAPWGGECRSAAQGSSPRAPAGLSTLPPPLTDVAPLPDSLTPTSACSSLATPQADAEAAESRMCEQARGPKRREAFAVTVSIRIALTSAHGKHAAGKFRRCTLLTVFRRVGHRWMQPFKPRRSRRYARSPQIVRMLF